MVSRILSTVLLILVGQFANAESDKADSSKLSLLNSTSVFKPLIADTKWPRFTLAYHHYMESANGRHIFAPNFGAPLTMIRNQSNSGTIYELSVHAGLFAIMDVGSSPTRLINADYFVGPAFVMQDSNVDYMLRISHTSSHLGDEFMLSKQGKNLRRINLSYETIEGIVAYNFKSGVRPYLGIGYIVHADPKDYKCPELTLGFNYRSPNTLIDGFARPIFGVHSKLSKNYNWNPSLSIKGGLEVEDKVFIGKALQVLIEYYNGHSIHGQFYKKHESYIGTSLNVNF